MAKKSIVEEALLEAKQLEEALKKNSKEILAATMKRDIDEMVKASLNEDEMADEDEGLDMESQMEGSEDESSTTVMDEEDEIISSEEDSVEDDSTGADDEVDDDSMGVEMPSDDSEIEVDDDVETTEEPTEDSEEVLDMTMASPDKLISVFKLMDDNDEIEVIKTGDGVELKDHKTGAEYMIKMDESIDANSLEDEDESMSYEDESMSYKDEDESMSYEDEDESSMDKLKKMFSVTSKDESSCDECGWQENDEPIYEITFDDSEEEDDEDSDDFDPELHKMISKIKRKPKDVEDDDEDDLPPPPKEDRPGGMFYEDEDESWGASDEGTRRTLHDRRAKQIHPQNYPMNESIKSEYKKVIKEYKELKDKYLQTKDALKVFRDKLSEIALFNSNLTHSVKLFMEHATTKQEKTDIMKRFDEEAVTLKESKRLYKTISNELKDRKPISEKVEKKINESLTKGSSDTLIESKVYVDPQISKIHDLMDKLDNRK